MGSYVSTPPGDSASPGYSLYVALLTQLDFNAPTVTVLHNTLGGTPVWTRDDVGEYRITLAGTFTLNKTVIFFGPTSMDLGAGVSQNIPAIATTQINSDYIQIYTTLQASDSFTDNNPDAGLNGTSIEIRVYP